MSEVQEVIAFVLITLLVAGESEVIQGNLPDINMGLWWCGFCQGAF